MNAQVAYGYRGIESLPGINKRRGCGISEILKKRGLTLQVIQDAAPGYLECGSGMNSRALREIMLSFSEDALAVTAL